MTSSGYIGDRLQVALFCGLTGSSHAKLGQNWVYRKPVITWYDQYLVDQVARPNYPKPRAVPKMGFLGEINLTIDRGDNETPHTLYFL